MRDSVRAGSGLQVQNLTEYRTTDLARLVRAGVRAEGGPRDLHVRVTRHPIRTRGCADLHGHSITLALGPGASKTVAQVARILRHELAHLRGQDHHQMTERVLYSEGPEPPWSSGLTLRRSRKR